MSPEKMGGGGVELKISICLVTLNSHIGLTVRCAHELSLYIPLHSSVDLHTLAAVPVQKCLIIMGVSIVQKLGYKLCFKLKTLVHTVLPLFSLYREYNLSYWIYQLLQWF